MHSNIQVMQLLEMLLNVILVYTKTVNQFKNGDAIQIKILKYERMRKTNKKKL